MYMCVFSRYDVDCLRPFAVRGEYRTSAAGGQSVTTIATGVEFVFEQRAVMVKYAQDGKTRKLDITQKLVAQNFAVSGGIEFENDPGHPGSRLSSE